ncbi:hypothetical protein AcW1_006525 [Taiwanofungus camphoratus]|nr:hypothetical protein AcW1_006525 [Antrodia cinnamomea]
MKYMMEDIVTVLKKHLLDNSLGNAHPIRVFCIACRWNFYEEAVVAARRTLGMSIDGVYVPELEEICAAHYYTLLQYNRTKGASHDDSFPPSPAPNSSTSADAQRQTTSTSPSFYSYMPISPTDADLLLRSSDGCDFPVHDDILSIASPVFRRKIADKKQQVEQCATKELASADSLITIDVSENSQILVQLLRFCYPVDAPNLFDLTTTRLLRVAAEKYKMIHALTT